MKARFLRTSSRGLFLTLIVFAFAPAFAKGAEASPERRGAPRLHFSAPPTEAEIFSARVFDEPLIPMNGSPSVGETKALADALEAYAERASVDDCASLEAFVEANPGSAWKGSLLLHLGTEYYNYGYFSKALAAWEQAWEEGQKITDGPGKVQADRALGELARMYSKLGRLGDLERLLESNKDRQLSGPATQLIHAAQEAAWVMKNKADYAFACGPGAVEKIFLNSQPAKRFDPALLAEYKSSTNGFCLSKVAELAGRLGMNYQMAHRDAGAPFIVPSVVHWKVEHYAALLANEGGRILVQDYTFHNSLWMTTNALEHEASGYFLVPPGNLPAGWRTVPAIEAQTVWGKGFDNGGTPGSTTQPWDSTTGGCNCQCSAPSPTPNPAPSGNSRGMATYTMHTMLASLTINDTPVGYRPPVGLPVQFQVTYNQLEAYQPATFTYMNLGQKWDCNWLSYITDSPTSPNADVSMYAAGGGTLNFMGFNSATQSFPPEVLSQGVLVKTSSSSYELTFPDGSKNEFAQSDGSTGSSRRVFLTQKIDPLGNAVQLKYDSQLRLTNIIDAIGQVTRLSYTNATYPLAVTSVADPFGRTAYFQYNASGMLSQITDVLGLTSQFTYATNEFVTGLTTPYGTTKFAAGLTNGTTYLLATDPDGGSELLESWLNSIGGPSIYPANLVPHGMSTFNLFLDARNCLFWNKRAFVEGAGDYTKAVIYHWLHSTPNEGALLRSGIMESVKYPLENRIWYNYPGQPTNFTSPYYLDAGYSGSSAKPSVVARILDDGSEQTSYYSYNGAGNLTQSIDPLGRTLSYVYASNNIDLLQVRMTNNGKNELVSTASYNAQHLPLTLTDAAGQTTVNTYNSRGQLLTVTDPANGKTTLSYDPNGYLLSITGPLSGVNNTTAFTYDAFGRIATATDTEGYGGTYSYDNFDRITMITFPDGTFEQYVYDRLALAEVRDRLGRWTTNTYNAEGQLLSVQDPLGRISHFDWCACGSLGAITDPLGRTTKSVYDVESRLISRQHPDGTSVSYTYENTTSRLKSKLDERGQTTLYKYYMDDRLATVSYANTIVPMSSVSYTYDPDYPRIVTMQDGVGTTAYSYNPITSPPAIGAGLLASVSGPLPNSMVTYQYDQLGRLTSRAINGVAEAMTLDAVGRSTTRTNALGIFQYTYAGATARVATETYPNGQKAVYSYYDGVGDERVQQVQNFKPGGALLSGFGYGYNAAGLITSWTNQWDALPTRVWTAAYDAGNQLTNVSSAGGSSTVTNYTYGYDAAADRTLAASNAAQFHFAYNALGQLASSDIGSASGTTYEWDAENRLTAINQGTARSEFTYDGLGRRAKVVEKLNGVVTQTAWFLWCGGQLCEQRDSTGANVVRRFLPEGEVVIGGGGSTNLFYTRDHLGSIREAMDSSGTLQARYDYDPYGQQTVLAENLNTTFAFTGDFQHRPSGLYFALHRGFDPRLGRWLNRDPLGESAGFNLYAYVGNDPLNGTDPSGEFFFLVIPAIIYIPAIAAAASAAIYGIVKAATSDNPPVTTAKGAAALVVGAGVLGAAGGAGAAYVSAAYGTAAAGGGGTIIVNEVIQRGPDGIRSISPPGCF